MRNFILFAFLLPAAWASGQHAYRIQSDQSTMMLSGETNLSDWEQEVVDFKGSLLFVEAAEPEFQAIELQIPVEAIQASKKGMRKDTYEALLKDEHPEIAFASRQIIPVNGNAVQITGKLTIAGVSQEVTIEATVRKENGTIYLSGTHTLSMLDYKVTPPTAMLGTLKVKAPVVITFNLSFSKS
jgi:polyisoprenoid-binding protein YceI